MIGSPLPSTVDAVVVGAGPNGLVAANRLADAGWEVLLVEAQADVGGAVRSDREVHPDFVHDTFSAFYPMAAASPVITALGPAGVRVAVASRPRRAGSSVARRVVDDPAPRRRGDGGAAGP